jgi:hypothetical protein
MRNRRHLSSRDLPVLYRELHFDEVPADGRSDGMTMLTDYLGRSVRLTDERKQHILTHLEMMGLEQAIIRVVREPQSVVQSQSDPLVQLSYRRQMTAEFGEKWLCVAVKYMPDDPFVLTAYLTDKIKAGVSLWPKP